LGINLFSLHSPSVAIVILNWNGQKYLQAFLPSVLASTYPNYKVIVADNASTDDSLLLLKEKFPTVALIELPENYGFAGGYNEALKQVEADYYVLLNSDVEVTPGWLQPIITLLEQNATAAACQPKILAWHQKDTFEYAGGAGGWIDSFGYPFARGRIFDVCEKDNGQYNTVQKVFWASGAALVIRSKVFHQLKGFDPYFFAHMEEIDLCWRMQLAGYDVFCQPASVVYHVGGGTLPQGNSRKTFLNFRNNLVMLAKNLSWREKWWKLPYRMTLDEVAAFKSLLGGDVGYFFAVVKANLAFVHWFFLGRKIKQSFRTKPLHQLNGVYKGHIILQFFIKKKTTFKQIQEGILETK
jgi:hypothetical protein